ncbi:MAG: hypothetical protein AABX71_02420, partial [Nanoarchaeota archaeon]
ELMKATLYQWETDYTNRYPFVIRSVHPEEYDALKADADLSKLIAGTAKEDGVQLSFKYNLFRKAIGLFIKKADEERLVLDDEGLSDLEKRLMRLFRTAISSRLDKIRIPHEPWC